MKLIVCAGMPRAGSTLQWKIVESIVRLVEPKAPSRSGFRKCAPLLKQNRSGYVIVRVHGFWDKTLPLHPKVITCCRDPRGIAASCMRVGWTIERVLQELPMRIKHFERWVAVPDALAMRYEAFTKDIAKTARYVARWLDIPLSEEQAQAIADNDALTRQLPLGNWEEDLTAEQQAAVIFVARDFMLRTKYLKAEQVA